jgi:hypothetical protein
MDASDAPVCRPRGGKAKTKPMADGRRPGSCDGRPRRLRRLLGGTPHQRPYQKLSNAHDMRVLCDGCRVSDGNDDKDLESEEDDANSAQGEH